MSRPTQRARRQAIEEQRADRPSLLSRVGPLSRVAAGVLVLLGAGALTVHLSHGHLSGTADSSGSAVAGPSVASPVLAAPIQATGTNYSRSQLTNQIPALVSSALTVAEAAGGTPRDTAEDTAKAASVPAPVTATTTADGFAANRLSSAAPQALASGQPGQLLRSPQALQACLTAIGANQQPVAVDLARYAGQEAAIIVLPAIGGGYQVEVVARDCRPGDDGSIDVVTLPSS